MITTCTKYTKAYAKYTVIYNSQALLKLGLASFIAANSLNFFCRLTDRIKAYRAWES